jgi:RNA polymerase sigma-70 factor (ECF subfamily)
MTTKNYCLDQLKAKRTGNLKIVHTNYVDREAGLDKKMEDLDSLNWVEKIMSITRTTTIDYSGI